MKLFIKLFSFILIISCTKCLAQNSLSDISLIKNKDYSIVVGDHNYRGDLNINNKEPLNYKNKSFIARYNPLSLSATSLMLFYQHIISPQFSRHCLYQRSCSNYGKAAIHEFGLVKGVFLSADRMLRCNFSAIGEIPADSFDPAGYAIDEPVKYHIRKK